MGGEVAIFVVTGLSDAHDALGGWLIASSFLYGTTLGPALVFGLWLNRAPALAGRLVWRVPVAVLVVGGAAALLWRLVLLGDAPIEGVLAIFVLGLPSWILYGLAIRVPPRRTPRSRVTFPHAG
jgi:hypothetical protein